MPKTVEMGLVQALMDYELGFIYAYSSGESHVVKSAVCIKFKESVSRVKG